MQVELVMLDPYVRARLAHDGAGSFSTRVKVPDVYGVFKWVLEYRRLGYSYIELSGGCWAGAGEGCWFAALLAGSSRASLCSTVAWLSIAGPGLLGAGCASPADCRLPALASQRKLARCHA
jgi:hypothetical protein